MDSRGCEGHWELLELLSNTIYTSSSHARSPQISQWRTKSEYISTFSFHPVLVASVRQVSWFHTATSRDVTYGMRCNLSRPFSFHLLHTHKACAQLVFSTMRLLIEGSTITGGNNDAAWLFCRLVCLLIWIWCSPGEENCKTEAHNDSA